MDKEIKSLKSGTRFKPSIYRKLKILSQMNNLSIADTLEKLILKEFNLFTNKNYVYLNDSKEVNL